MIKTDDTKKKLAVLAAVQQPDVSDEEHEGSLAELSRLVTTLGFEVVGQISQKRKTPAPGTFLGEGKLTELAAYVEEKEADIVILDSDISPTQLKNLEEATKSEVLDRSGVILEIFSRHAKSREAHLQVEIAKLGYMAPRLRASSIGGDRQGGGIGSKGSGETTHELDRRRIRDRISELKGQLELIREEQGTRRAQRTDAPVVALVGYTNAGKSSLMRALTGSEVLVADKLFATLDTTVRALQPETVPRILVSDTVGFIKKLPHDLVASFRSTLDEALNASLLLFVVDAADATFRSQLEVTRTALQEIGADKIDQHIVLNKIDKLDKDQLMALRAEYPQAIFISTRKPADIDAIKKVITDYFEKDMVEKELVLPYTKNNLIGFIRDEGKVLSEDYEDHGVVVKVRCSKEALARITKKIGSSSI
jgi:GTP-binding protein HflX